MNDNAGSVTFRCKIRLAPMSLEVECNYTVNVNTFLPSCIYSYLKMYINKDFLTQKNTFALVIGVMFVELDFLMVAHCFMNFVAKSGL
jgi:hypothetical protein